jgi:hypothetical protein
MEEDEICRICNMGVEEMRSAYRVLVRKPEWNKPCGRH